MWTPGRTLTALGWAGFSSDVAVARGWELLYYQRALPRRFCDPAMDSTRTQVGAPENAAPSRRTRLFQSIIAMIVTVGALWFLFGIPAYLLFGGFFD